MNVFQPLIDAAWLLAEGLESTFQVDPEKEQVIQQSLSLEAGADLGAWLGAQGCNQKLYWRARDGSGEMAALGWDRHWHDEDAWRQLEASTKAMRFWLSGFDADLRWHDWPDALLLQPDLAVVREGPRLRIQVQCPPGRALALAANLRSWHGRVVEAAALPSVTRCDEPGRPCWAREVNAVRRAISAGELDKVVLARRTRLESASDIPLWALFRRWRGLSQRCYQLVFQEGDQGFLSFSPERLFRRDHPRLSSEALAGTFWHRESSPEAEGIDAKISQEHALVVGDLQRKLSGCCDELRADDAIGLYSQPNLQHLYCGFSGSLRAGVGDAELLRRLHPTAAVSGLPAQPAAAFIRRQEIFNRGWYAGCFGPVTRNESELAVAIRSGRLKGRQLDLYAGAGIVMGSEADLEWQELDRKMALPLSLFEVTGDMTPSQDGYVSPSASHS